MINSHELMVGNFITIAHESNIPIIKVEGILGELVYSGGTYPLSLAMPIELNEDWLIKFAFLNLYNEITGEFFYKKEDIIIYKIENKFVFDLPFLRNKYGLEIKHVHQLQNLFFALTNQELTAQL